MKHSLITLSRLAAAFFVLCALASAQEVTITKAEGSTNGGEVDVTATIDPQGSKVKLTKIIFLDANNNVVHEYTMDSEWSGAETYQSWTYVGGIQATKVKIQHSNGVSNTFPINWGP